IFGLLFLSSNEVTDTFSDLISICLDGFLFSNYILNNYIDKDCFLPLIWAEKPQITQECTNAVESFHRTYNCQFYYSRPPIY
ncbi:Uncharacterized protein FWK35_00002145, partial [Aphis craccivora]